MLEITRDLLEHYLRATGWETHGNGNMSATKYPKRGRTLYWANDASIADGIALEANRSGAPSFVVAFRLGLCAAADRAFAQGREFRAIHQGAWAMKSDDLAVDYLTGAGIDPAAWESARKR